MASEADLLREVRLLMETIPAEVDREALEHAVHVQYELGFTMVDLLKLLIASVIFPDLRTKELGNQVLRAWLAVLSYVPINPLVPPAPGSGGCDGGAEWDS